MEIQNINRETIIKMRLQNYISESYIYLPDEINTINNFISKECGPYLKLIRNKNPLYRGMHHKDQFGVKSVRSDRRQRGYSIEVSIYKQLNEWLEENGHNRRDNTVICTSNRDWVDQFGDLYMIFPMGKISYTWIYSNDFNISDKKTGWVPFATTQYLEMDNDSDLLKPFDEYFVTDKKFNVAYKKGYEFWIKCNKYYFVKDDDSIVWDEKYQVIV